MRVPYIRRLQRKIDELQHRLAMVEEGGELHPVIESYSLEVGERFPEFLRYLRPHPDSEFSRGDLRSLVGLHGQALFGDLPDRARSIQQSQKNRFPSRTPGLLARPSCEF